MKNPICQGCSRDERKKSGYLCKKVKSPDNLIHRCSHRESFLKLKMLKYYLDIFCVAMKDKFKNLNFIDLFAGPGICYDRDTDKFEPGSPLISLDINYPFTKYIFVDIGTETSNALKIRCQKHHPALLSRMEFLNRDANSDIEEILGFIEKNKSITVVFIDPNGLDINFNTIEKLSKYRSIDIIINFSISDLKRNLAIYKKPGSKAYDFFGIKDWHKYQLRDLASIYKKQLMTLGFIGLEDEHEGSVAINAPNGAPIYYLIFASKHPTLGIKFWKEAKRRYMNPHLFE